MKIDITIVKGEKRLSLPRCNPYAETFVSLVRQSLLDGADKVEIKLSDEPSPEQLIAEKEARLGSYVDGRKRVFKEG